MDGVAGGELVAGRLDVERAASAAELGGAHLHQPDEVRGGVVLDLEAEAHVEDIHAGRVRLASARPEGAEHGFLSVEFAGREHGHCAEIESHELHAGRHAAPAQAVAGRRRGHAGHGGAVIAADVVVERVRQRGAGRLLEPEIVRFARFHAGGQVRVADLESGIQHGQRDAVAVVAFGDGRGHAKVRAGHAGAGRERRLPGVVQVPLVE